MNFLISLDGKLRIYGELFGMRRKRRIGNFRFGVSRFIPPWQKLLSDRQMNSFWFRWGESSPSYSAHLLGGKNDEKGVLRVEGSGGETNLSGSW